MASYRLSGDAEDDVRRLYRRGIEAFGLAQADRYFDGLFERFDVLAAQPHLYPAVNEIRAGYRRSIYGVHAIYYRVVAGQVDIMRVLGRENPEVHLF